MLKPTEVEGVGSKERNERKKKKVIKPNIVLVNVLVVVYK